MDSKLKVGDILWFVANKNSKFYPGIECEVIEMDGDRITKMKAVVPDPELAKIGFFEEDGEYVSMPYDIIKPN